MAGLYFNLNDEVTSNHDEKDPGKYLAQIKQKLQFFPWLQLFCAWDDTVEVGTPQWTSKPTPEYDMWLLTLKLRDHSRIAKFPDRNSEPWSSKVAIMDILSQDHVVTLSGRFHEAMLDSAKLMPAGHLGHPTPSWWLHIDDTLHEYQGYQSRHVGIATNSPAYKGSFVIKEMQPAAMIEDVSTPCVCINKSPPAMAMMHAGGRNKRDKQLYQEGRLCLGARTFESCLYGHPAVELHIDTTVLRLPFPTSVCRICNHRRVSVTKYYEKRGAAGTNREELKANHLKLFGTVDDLVCACSFCQCCVARKHYYQPRHMFCKCPGCTCDCTTDDPTIPHNLPATVYAKWLWPQQNVGAAVPAYLV